MNVLLLTPDAVGGTLLERMITISMQLQDIDRPFIDVGHIELGLETYYNESFNQMILRSTNDIEYKQMQSLPEIRDLLSSVDHYSAIKLPFYNMLARGDDKSHQVPFYKYLNDNFFVISCRRQNLFEHALSWAFNKITHQLNVYDPVRKIQTFLPMYRNGIEIDPLVIRHTLNDYKKYIDWCDTHFQIGSFYFYEKHMPQIERYVLSLPIFQRLPKLKQWKEVYGQDFSDWNRCHYFLSDMAPLLENNFTDVDVPQIEHYQKPEWNTSKITQDLISSYDRVADPTWPKIKSFQDWLALPSYIIEECTKVHGLDYYVDQITIAERTQEYPVIDRSQSKAYAVDVISAATKKHHEHLIRHRGTYNKVCESIDQMQSLGILTQGVPIKKQTLKEKQQIVTNFSECLDEYNRWIQQHPDLGQEISQSDVDEMCQQEKSYWNTSNQLESNSSPGTIKTLGR